MRTKKKKTVFLRERTYIITFGPGGEGKEVEEREMSQRATRVTGHP